MVTNLTTQEFEDTKNFFEKTYEKLLNVRSESFTDKTNAYVIPLFPQRRGEYHRHFERLEHILVFNKTKSLSNPLIHRLDIINYTLEEGKIYFLGKKDLKMIVTVIKDYYNKHLK